MALPVKQKTWVLTVNNRITFVSLTDTTQRILHGFKTFLKANGYTVKGSASAGTGAMDAVDRWTATTDVTPQGAASGNSQAWIVLTDGSGTEILIAFQGATGDIYRVSICSDGTGFSAAGTPNQQPTSSLGNEQVLSSASSMIGATASGDRLWSGWVDSTHKMCRLAVASAGNWVGRFWGVEIATPCVVAPAVWSPPVWGLMYSASSINILLGASIAGFARTVNSSTARLLSVVAGNESFSASMASFLNVKTPQNGGAGYLMWGFSLGSSTASGEGKIGNMIDQWWTSTTTAVTVAGDTLGTNDFINMGIAGNGACTLWWPWNSATTPQMT